MPCAPPPPPPANPCVPAQSATFYCNSSTSMCYTHVTAAYSHSKAVATCKAQGGQLWFPRTMAEAAEVEGQFGLTNANGGIWLGLKRRGMHAWYSVDGSYWLPEWPTMGGDTGLYAHWGRDQYTAKLDVNMDMDCVAGQTYTLQYAVYTCDPGAETSRMDAACYQTATTYGSGRRLAWRALGCGAALPFVCSTPASAFQCPPPPAPSQPPPPPVCEWPGWVPCSLSRLHMPVLWLCCALCGAAAPHGTSRRSAPRTRPPRLRRLPREQRHPVVRQGRRYVLPVQHGGDQLHHGP